METGNSEVRCDHCGCAFVPVPVTEMDGDIAYTFFRCDYCGKAFMVCVTDPKLCNDIYEYAVLAERNKITRLPEEEQRRMQQMKADNIRRAEELRRMYLREVSDDGE